MKKILILIPLIFFFSCGDEKNSKLSSGTSIEEFKAVSSTCFKPRERGGSKCSFYKECLEASIACEGTDYPYAISYGDRYCNKFENIASRLSEKGRGWSNETLYCLQEAIVLWNGKQDTTVYLGINPPPAYDPEVYGTCQYVRLNEFRMHPKCYLGGPSQFSKRTHTSICELPWLDSARILTTVTPGDLFTRESGAQVVEVAKACIPMYLTLPPLVTSPVLIAEWQKTRDFWQWAQKKGEAESIGQPAPPPPASIAIEMGGLS